MLFEVFYSIIFATEETSSLRAQTHTKYIMLHEFYITYSASNLFRSTLGGGNFSLANQFSSQNSDLYRVKTAFFRKECGLFSSLCA